jgi:hypothetical protein
MSDARPATVPADHQVPVASDRQSVGSPISRVRAHRVPRLVVDSRAVLAEPEESSWRQEEEIAWRLMIPVTSARQTSRL